jgi:hypothetical protein
MTRLVPGGRGATAFVATTLLSAAVLAAQNQPPPPGPQSMQIRVDGEAVTAEIRNTPAHAVFEELAARTGVIFEVAEKWNPLISLVLYRTTIEEAIQRATAPGDSILYFGRDAAGRNRITVVRVFPRGLKGQPASLRVIGTGTTTKTSDDDPIQTADQALRALSTSAKLEVRQKAVEVLAAAKSPAAAQALLGAVDDKAVEVRVAAIEALAGMNEPAALPRILEALKDPNPGARQAAVEAVAQLGTAQNVKDLRPLARDRDPGVAGAAGLAIRRLSERR